MSNYEKGFFSVKNNAIFELKKGYLLRMYSYLVSKDFKGEGIWHSQQTMANDLGVSVRTIQRHLKELKELGYIEFFRRGFNQTNIYHIIKNVVKKGKEAKEELTKNFKSQFTTILAKSKAKKLKFDNFEGRNYSREDWDSLERKLLGWE